MAAKGGYTEVVDCLLEREPHINVTDQVRIFFSFISPEISLQRRFTLSWSRDLPPLRLRDEATRILKNSGSLLLNDRS